MSRFGRFNCCWFIALVVLSGVITGIVRGGDSVSRDRSSETARTVPALGPAPLVTVSASASGMGAAPAVQVSPLSVPEPAGIEPAGIDTRLPGTGVPERAVRTADELDAFEKTKRSGIALLDEHRWNEARTLLEKAYRKYPGDAEIGHLFLESRCCFEICCRYQDESFLSMLKSLDRQSAMMLYDEIFGNILRYHVDTPHFDQLLLLGLDSLRHAFLEEEFLQYYKVTPENAANLVKYCDMLKTESKKWNVASYSVLRGCVAGIADLIEQGAAVPASAVVLEFACGMTVSLDPYSTFLTKSQMNDIYSMIDGHFVGLGVELRSDNNILTISRVIPDSPAAQHGLKRGEQIVAIDGVPVGGKQRADQAGNLLQGREGTSVALKILALDGVTVRDANIVRRRVDVPSVENVHIMNPESQSNRIGYARINCFQKTTLSELTSAMRYLHSQQMSCFIIDLRQNPGGLLQEAIEITDLFVAQGMIVKTRGRQSEKPYYAGVEGTSTVPLVVLIDGNSASASEIFAGAIHDNRRGLIVGTRSFGKGTVQAIIQLNGRENGQPVAGMRLTTEKFYAPSGYAYSGVGVQPDVTVDEEQMRMLTDQENAPVFRNVADGADSNDYCLAKAFEEAQRILLSDRAVSQRQR